MLKVGDKVRVVRDIPEKCLGCTTGVVLVKGTQGVITDVLTDTLHVKFGDTLWGLKKEDLELVEQPTVMGHTARTFIGHPEGVLKAKDAGTGKSHTIRTFDSGATRDTTQGKLDYVKALSPIVLRRYVQYLDKHRLQPDGSYRNFDNWKQGIPEEVYHSSGGRHFFDTWLLTEGYMTEDNHGEVDMENALCAQLFNIMGRLHEILKVKILTTRPICVIEDRTTSTPGGY